jgi:aspartyl-tRNA synthetase
MQTRHNAALEVRKFLSEQNFIEIETPILTSSSPEGARDFLVPARLSNGEFFALPQSPQLFKQLLMVGGLDKYYQIAKCFRDEDLRADRQPEFTQLDIEMSFISEEEIISFNEKLIKNVWKNVLNINFNEEFPRMTWQEAMDNYGTDRPDTRYEMLLKNLGGILGNIGFNIFTRAIQNGGAIKSITIKDGNTSISNVRIKPGGDIFKVAQDAGAGGLAFIRVKGDELETIGAIKNNLNKDHISNILKITEAKDGDLILLGAGNTQIVNQSLDRVRQYIAKDLKLIEKDKWNFLWVTDFPMFEMNEEEKRFEALHHPFCSPKNIKLEEIKELKEKIEDINESKDLSVDQIDTVPELPDVIESLSPMPRAQVPQQTILEIDLPIGYEIELFIDDYRISSNEIEHIEGTGVYRWKPGPGKSFESWTPGEHVVKIYWDTSIGLPDIGEFVWEFSTY